LALRGGSGEVFKPLPFVSRIIFLATPHQGSYMSGGWPSRLLSSMISTPKKLVELTQRLVTDEKTGLPKAIAIRIPPSIENMEPGSPFNRKRMALCMLAEGTDSAGINRHGVENERVLHQRPSQPR
jgi:hypothetical protein